jgi:hypothetical protein
VVIIQFSHQSLQQVVVAQQPVETLADLVRQLLVDQDQVLVQDHHHQQQVEQLHRVKATQVAIVRVHQQQQVVVEPVRLEATQVLVQGVQVVTV